LEARWVEEIPILGVREPPRWGDPTVVTACFVPSAVVDAAVGPASNAIATVANEDAPAAFWTAFRKLLVHAFTDEASNPGEREAEVGVCEGVGVWASGRGWCHR